MDLIWAFLVSVMPMLAMLPLALAAVAIVALLVVPPVRHALGAWAARRFGAVGSQPANAEEVRELRAAVVALERRLDAGTLPAADRTREIEEER